MGLERQVPRRMALVSGPLWNWSFATADRLNKKAADDLTY